MTAKIVRSPEDHGCRAEPHCICGDNAWYHRDTDDEGMAGAAECGMQGCDCQRYTRCTAFRLERS